MSAGDPGCGRRGVGAGGVPAEWRCHSSPLRLSRAGPPEGPPGSGRLARLEMARPGWERTAARGVREARLPLPRRAPPRSARGDPEMPRRPEAGRRWRGGRGGGERVPAGEFSF